MGETGSVFDQRFGSFDKSPRRLRGRVGPGRRITDDLPELRNKIHIDETLRLVLARRARLPGPKNTPDA